MLQKLSIFCFKIVVKSKNILVKFTFFIYNQQLSFTLAIPSSLYTNNDDNNGSRVSILKKNYEFFNGISVTKHGNQFKAKKND
jgi:hypothetical protein